MEIPKAIIFFSGVAVGVSIAVVAFALIITVVLKREPEKYEGI